MSERRLTRDQKKQRRAERQLEYERYLADRAERLRQKAEKYRQVQATKNFREWLALGVGKTFRCFAKSLGGAAAAAVTEDPNWRAKYDWRRR